MQKILEQWEQFMMFNELDEKPFGDCKLSKYVRNLNQILKVIISCKRYINGEKDLR